MGLVLSRGVVNDAIYSLAEKSFNTYQSLSQELNVNVLLSDHKGKISFLRGMVE